jgi:hypothetical protein
MSGSPPHRCVRFGHGHLMSLHHFGRAMLSVLPSLLSPITPLLFQSLCVNVSCCRAQSGPLVAAHPTNHSLCARIWYRKVHNSTRAHEYIFFWFSTLSRFFAGEGWQQRRRAHTSEPLSLFRAPVFILLLLCMHLTWYLNESLPTLLCRPVLPWSMQYLRRPCKRSQNFLLFLSGCMI